MCGLWVAGCRQDQKEEIKGLSYQTRGLDFHTGIHLRDILCQLGAGRENKACRMTWICYAMPVVYSCIQLLRFFFVSTKQKTAIKRAQVCVYICTMNWT